MTFVQMEGLRSPTVNETVTVPTIATAVADCYCHAQ